jgi:hypothetical protein
MEYRERMGVVRDGRRFSRRIDQKSLYIAGIFAWSFCEVSDEVGPTGP